MFCLKESFKRERKLPAKPSDVDVDVVPAPDSEIVMKDDCELLFLPSKRREFRKELDLDPDSDASALVLVLPSQLLLPPPDSLSSPELPLSSLLPPLSSRLLLLVSPPLALLLLLLLYFDLSLIFFRPKFRNALRARAMASICSISASRRRRERGDICPPVSCQLSLASALESPLSLSLSRESYSDSAMKPGLAHLLRRRMAL